MTTENKFLVAWWGTFFLALALVVYCLQGAI